MYTCISKKVYSFKLYFHLSEVGRQEISVKRKSRLFPRIPKCSQDRTVIWILQECFWKTTKRGFSGDTVIRYLILDHHQNFYLCLKVCVRQVPVNFAFWLSSLFTTTDQSKTIITPVADFEELELSGY